MTAADLLMPAGIQAALASQVVEGGAIQQRPLLQRIALRQLLSTASNPSSTCATQAQAPESCGLDCRCCMLEKWCTAGGGAYCASIARPTASNTSSATPCFSNSRICTTSPLRRRLALHLSGAALSLESEAQTTNAACWEGSALQEGA